MKFITSYKKFFENLKEDINFSKIWIHDNDYIEELFVYLSDENWEISIERKYLKYKLKKDNWFPFYDEDNINVGTFYPVYLIKIESKDNTTDVSVTDDFKEACERLNSQFSDLQFLFKKGSYTSYIPININNLHLQKNVAYNNRHRVSTIEKSLYIAAYLDSFTIDIKDFLEDVGIEMPKIDKNGVIYDDYDWEQLLSSISFKIDNGKEYEKIAKERTMEGMYDMYNSFYYDTPDNSDTILEYYFDEDALNLLKQCIEKEGLLEDEDYDIDEDLNSLIEDSEVFSKINSLYYQQELDTLAVENFDLMINKIEDKLNELLSLDIIKEDDNNDAIYRVKMDEDVISYFNDEMVNNLRYIKTTDDIIFEYLSESIDIDMKIYFNEYSSPDKDYFLNNVKHFMKSYLETGDVDSW